MKSNTVTLITKNGMPEAIEIDGHRIPFVASARVIFDAGDHLKVSFEVYCSEVLHVEELDDASGT